MADHDAARRTESAEDKAEHQTSDVETSLSAEGVQASFRSLLGSSALTGRGNSHIRIALMQSMQRTHGNRAVQRYLHGVRAVPQRASQEEIASQDGTIDGSPTTEISLPGPVNALDRKEHNFVGPKLAQLPMSNATVQRKTGGLLSVQRDITGNPKTTDGEWHINGSRVEKAGEEGGQSGIDITLKFTPKKGAPYSNKIGIVQIAKVTDEGGANVATASLPASPPERWRALTTDEDKEEGVQGGFQTDVPHHHYKTNTDSPEKGEQTQNYTGAANASSPPIYGFKRSDEVDGIGAAEITDFPSTSNKKHKLHWSFETVARGDDVQHVYGSVRWSFGVKEGKVVDENGPSATDTASATFDAAIEKHRDFYTHEPASFYFDFDSVSLSGAEADKIDNFLDYLVRNPDVRLSVQGFADKQGKAAHNQRLSEERAASVAQALQNKGVDRSRITIEPPGGETIDFTFDLEGLPGFSLSPVEVGDISKSEDSPITIPRPVEVPSNVAPAQNKEANRRGNRVVIVKFVRTEVPITPETKSNRE